MSLRNTEIDSGAIRGVACGIPNFTVYKGIPFAANTGGSNRFMPPQPVAPWSGEYLCSEFKPISMQAPKVLGTKFSNFFKKEFYPFDYPMSEDNLFLNVWTPAEHQDENLPVMVWIHGGGLGSGYSYEMEFDGEAICKRGCILVTISYRLDGFGFFAHPELTQRSSKGVSGNNGFLDQVAALEWVSRNISAFGGNPDNVTIFGQSAGGASVLAHLVSPLSEGLFHRAIIQSGTFGIATRLFFDSLEQAEKWGVDFCRSIGKSLDEVLAMPAADLQIAFEQASENGVGRRPAFVTDNYAFPDGCGEAILAGKIKNVSIMSGSVRGDSALMAMIGGAPADPVTMATRQRIGAKADELISKYPPQEPENADLYEAVNNTAAYYGDLIIGSVQQKDGKIPAHVYYFDSFIPDHDVSEFVEDGVPYHSSELWYIFGTLARCWRKFDGRHYDLSSAMTDYWTNFARQGDPNGEGLPEWHRFEGSEPRAMVFKETGIVEQCLVDESVSKLISYTIKN